MENLDKEINNQPNDIKLNQIDLFIYSISKQSNQDEIINWFQQSSLHWLIGLFVLRYHIAGEELSKQILVEKINDHVVMQGKKTVTTEFKYINHARDEGYIETYTSPKDLRKKLIKPTKRTIKAMSAWFNHFNDDFSRLI